MVRNELYITVPNFFKCPISLDVMKSPVSLCTGVTYDRSSIQKWLDNGNNTCPATMQVLQSKDFVPNLTLRRLIRTWSDNLENHPSEEVVSLHLLPSRSSTLLFRQQAKDLIKRIENIDENYIDCLSLIADSVEDSDENRKYIANIDGFVPLIIGLLSNANDDDVDYDVNIVVFEQAVRALDLMLTDYVGNNKEQLMRSMVRNQDFLSSMVLILGKGDLDSKIRSARVLGVIAADSESKLLIGEKEGILYELLRLISSKSSASIAIEAGLSCLNTILMSRRIRLRIVQLGSVQKLGKLLSDLDSSSFTASNVVIIEKVLKLLEMISTCTEGRISICEDPNCVKLIVQKMLKVSSVATENAVVILWSVCYLFRDKKAQEAVMKSSSNGLTKILLLMQSNCSSSVRQMCGDLLKIFRVNSKSCLSSYETKTTHIMPF